MMWGRLLFCSSVLLLALIHCVQTHGEPGMRIQGHTGSHNETKSHKEGQQVRGLCGTHLAWELKAPRKNNTLTAGASCYTRGTCDVPSVRDAFPNKPLTIKLAVIVVGQNSVTEQKIAEQIQTLNSFYGPYNINFVLNYVKFQPISGDQCIPAFSYTNNAWYYAAQNLKKLYAHNPSSNLNVVVSCQRSGGSGFELLGYATFPWDSDALTSSGGLWINSNYFGKGQMTMAHEIGHALGLWHTFRGTDETSGCSDPCTENVHSSSDGWADTVGDFCRDTPATPMNFGCYNPSGKDCSNKPWGSTAYTNIMSYAPDSCLLHLTQNQAQRAHCWTCKKLSSLLQNPANCQ